jgi:hypothetical protein
MPMAGQAAFRKRLQQAVNAIFDGNVTAAAEGLEISQPTLHKILSGKIKDSKASTISHLAKRLGVSEAWLRGANDPSIDNQTHPAVFPLPASAYLISRYFSAKRSKYIRWIERLGTPRTEAGAEIVEAYREWMTSKIQDKPRGDLVRACSFADLEPRISAGKGAMTPEHLKASRAVHAVDLAILELVVRTLKRLGEQPRGDE